MKVIKGIFYTILILTGAALLAAALAPKVKNVERTITIEAPKSVVFSQVANFKVWSKWDAWFEKDTLQERSYTGSLGDKNYEYSWKSESKDVGEGRLAMTKVTGTDRLDYRFFFNNSGEEDAANGYFTFEEHNSSTKVTWVMVSELSFPSKFFNYLIESWVAPDFEKGLSNLKKHIEDSKNKALLEIGRSVQIITEHGVNYAVVRAEKLPMSEMDAFFEKAYKQLYGYVQTNGLAPKGPSRGLYYEWDETNMQTTLAAAVPVSDIPEVELTNLDLGIGSSMMASDRVVCTVVGGYSKSYDVHMALDKWIKENHKTVIDPVVEEYIKGPIETSDTSEYVTKISYFYE